MNTLALEGLVISLAGLFTLAMWLIAAYQRDKARKELAGYKARYLNLLLKASNAVDSIGE